jgi:hypothetical protein
LSNVIANHSVVVTFQLVTQTVTPLVSGTNGTISPNTPQAVSYGGSITMTATPNAGYAVGIWAVDGVLAQTGGTKFTLSNVVANHSVVVTFKAGTYTVTPLVSGTNGTISPNTPQTVTSGGSLTMTATPNTGYTVGIWAVDGVLAQTGGTSFTLSNVATNHSVVVTFKANTYTVTPLVSGTNGTISPNTAQKVTSGGSLAMTATPNTGYTVGIWAVDGVLAQTGGTSFTLSSVVANHSVVVTFVVTPPSAAQPGSE